MYSILDIVFVYAKMTFLQYGWLVGWLVGCKSRAIYLYFCNHSPYLRAFPFLNLHPYLTAIRGNCKVLSLLSLEEFLGGLPY